MTEQIEQIEKHFLPSTFKHILQREHSAYKFLVQRAAQLPQVMEIYAIVDNGVIDLWTVVDGDLYQAGEALAELDIELLVEFPDLPFDFMTIHKNELDAETMPKNRTLIYSNISEKNKNG